MTLVVTRTTTPAELEIAMALRTQVFVHEMGLPAATDADGLDANDTTYHFLGKDVERDTFVAVARVVLDPVQRTARIGRVALREECRGKNYGAVLMEAVERAVASEADVLVLAALHSRKSFYERCGFRCVNDDVFEEHGYVSCMMTKTTAPSA